MYAHFLISHYILIQYGIKAGLKKFGEKGKKDTMKQLRQMLDREVFKKIKYKSLQRKDKINALTILLFLSKKQNKEVKAQKQKLWTKKAYLSSPTIVCECLFQSCEIDAQEEQDVASGNLPGHFLHTPMEGRVILKIVGLLALLFVEIDPETWQKHLRYVCGKLVVYVKCSKAIYGTVNAVLLLYRKLIGEPQGLGI